MEEEKLKNNKKEKKPIQHTKIIINMVIILTALTTLASIYINFKNNMGLDSIVNSCWDGLKFILPSQACKSFLETREEKRLEFIKELKNLAFDGNGNPITESQMDMLMNLVTSQFGKFETKGK